MFGDDAPWASVRVTQVPRMGFGAMVPLGKTIVFSDWEAAADFTKTPLHEQAWFVHELAHVWQASRGAVLPLAKLTAIGKAAYRYKVKPNAKLKDFGIEAQAEIARHLFLARQGQRPRGAPNREWLERIWPVTITQTDVANAEQAAIQNESGDQPGASA